MIERSNGPRLALETLPRVRLIRTMKGKDFGRNSTVETGVAGAVDLSHSTSTELDDNLVRTKPSTRCEGHGWRDYTAR
jgi:hypothetical protein